jgi:hypothetical protein
MRIRLMRMDSARDRIEWLSFHSGDDVLDTYAALFPHSVLPRYCRFVFWIGIVSAAIVLCAVTMLKAFGKDCRNITAIGPIPAFSPKGLGADSYSYLITPRSDASMNRISISTSSPRSASAFSFSSACEVFIFEASRVL